jgi:hypothetical protein
MSGDRWFNSDFGKRAGLALMIFGLGAGLGSCCEGCGRGEAAREKAQAQVENAQVLHTADLDGKGGPDEFYIIGQEIAPVKINGIPVMKYSFDGTNGHYRAKNSLGR